MNIDVTLVSYNGLCGHPALSYVGDFLLLSAPQSFGSAITTVDIYAHLQSSGPPLKTLGQMRDRFQVRLTTLPLAWFKPKEFLFEIAYFSKLGYAEDFFAKESKVVSLPLFHEACREIVSVLSMVRKRIKSTDDFDIESFDSYFQRRLRELPPTLSELETVLGEIIAKKKQEIAPQRHGE